MKSCADQEECYPQRPKAEIDNTFRDLQNSSYPTQPHSIIAKYTRAHVLSSNYKTRTTRLALQNKQFS